MVDAPFAVPSRAVPASHPVKALKRFKLRRRSPLRHAQPNFAETLIPCFIAGLEQRRWPTFVSVLVPLARRPAGKSLWTRSMSSFTKTLCASSKGRSQGCQSTLKHAPDKDKQSRVKLFFWGRLASKIAQMSDIWTGSPCQCWACHGSRWWGACRHLTGNRGEKRPLVWPWGRRPRQLFEEPNCWSSAYRLDCRPDRRDRRRASSLQPRPPWPGASLQRGTTRQP